MKMINTLSDIPANLEVAIYGAGGAGSMLRDYLAEYRPDLKLLNFIDSFAGGELDKLPVYVVDQYQRLPDRAALVVIASVHWRVMQETLEKVGLDEYLIVPPRFFSPRAQELFQRTDFAPLENPLAGEFFYFSAADSLRFAADLKRARSLFNRRADRELYDMITGGGEPCATNMRGITERYYHSTPRQQYFDHLDLTKLSSIIDGGAFDGKTALDFAQYILEGGVIYAFEPSRNLIAEGGFSAAIERDSRIEIIYQGLWDRSGTLSFYENGSSSSFVADGSCDAAVEKIPVIALDEFVSARGIPKIDFVKMDIEGAEYEALKGGLETIKKDRPQLAICLYHRQEHLFSIPLLLHANLTNYRYYLEHYQDDLTEIVLYAIPKECAA